MKKLLILILFPFFSLAQIDTSHVSLKNNDLALKEEIANLKWCLNKAHQVHTRGVHKAIAGIGLLGVGAFTKWNGNYELANVFLWTSGILITVGEFQMWRSYRWIKNASLGVTKNGITAKYTFKP